MMVLLVIVVASIRVLPVFVLEMGLPLVPVLVLVLLLGQMGLLIFELVMILLTRRRTLIVLRIL